jgi:hypothetical protein
MSLLHLCLGETLFLPSKAVYRHILEKIVRKKTTAHLFSRCAEAWYTTEIGNGGSSWEKYPAWEGCKIITLKEEWGRWRY